jgi:hypothetical protein
MGERLAHGFDGRDSLFAGLIRRLHRHDFAPCFERNRTPRLLSSGVPRQPQPAHIGPVLAKGRALWQFSLSRLWRLRLVQRSVPGNKGQFMSEPENSTRAAGGLAGLASAAQKAGSPKGLPPVHLWNPPDCGDIDMRIAADGLWYYNGTPIGRPAMVRLFSTILRRDGDRFVLVTPVEKVGITVDDAPFLAIAMTAEGEGRDQLLSFTTNVGDVTEAGSEHPLRVETDPGSAEPRPYVHVRGGLEALIGRAVFYDLVDRAVPGEGAAAGLLGVWSGGIYFPLGPLPEGWA